MSEVASAGVVDDSTGSAEGTRPSSTDLDSGNLYNGTIIDSGPGIEKGTNPSSPTDVISVDLHDGTALRDDPDAVEGTKWPSSSDVDVGR